MGRPVGKLVGLTADMKDEVTAIQVSGNDGEVTQYPMDFVKIIEAKPTVLQSWHVEAEGLRREFDIIRRRSQALDLLLKDGDINQEEFRQLRGNYEELTGKMNVKKEALLDTLKIVESKLEQQIRDLQTALTNDKMLYTSAEIDERTYQNVTDSIRSTLEIARKERRGVDNTREFLMRMDSTAKLEPAPIPTKSNIPDVVVIRMKEPTEA